MRIAVLSQPLAPLGICPSFGNHNISWIHNSNYISLNTQNLRYNRALPFIFLQPQRTFENVIYSAEMCRFTGDCQSPQITLLITIWQIRGWPFTDSLSDLIIVRISFISSSLYWHWQLYSKSNALVRQRHIVLFRASSDFTGKSTVDTFRYSRKYKRSLNSPSIHPCTLSVKIKGLFQGQFPKFCYGSYTWSLSHYW